MAFSNSRSLDAALRPGRLACVGEWSGKGKTMKITEEGDGLMLNMGQGSPTLIVVPTNKNTEEVWPMQWSAMREPSDDALYILELPTPTSSRLYVKKPGDDRIVEFVRGGASSPPAAQSDGHMQSNVSNLRPPPILTTGSQRSRSLPSLQPRSRSPRPRGRAGPPQEQGRWRRPSGGPLPRGDSTRDMSASEQAIREEMVTFVKRGQRESPAFKERWAAFCDRFGRGFYDPARHNTRFLEDFTQSERKGGHRSCSRRSSRSLSRRPARVSSPPPRRSQSRHRSLCRRRRRCIRRGPSRMQRRLRGPRRGARGRCHRNRSASGMPSRQAARRGAEAALADAERQLARVRDAAVPDTAEAIRKAEEERQSEIIRAVEIARRDADENLHTRLSEAEAKLQREKAERMREAEHKLDKAIASRLREAEERLRQEVDARVEEVRRSTEESTRAALEDAERRAQAEASAKVKEGEERVQKARARAASLRDSNEKHSGSEGESGGTSSSSYSGSASPCREGTSGAAVGGGGGPGRGGAYERPWH